MQKLLHDYGIFQEHLTIYCDNTSAINISKNLIQHSWTKHIEIRHHFIRELVEDGTLTLEFIHTDDQKADLLPNLLIANGLNSFTKTLVSSPWIDLSFSSFFLMHLHLFLCIALFNMFLFVFFSVLLYFVFSYKIKKKIEKKKIQKQGVFVYIDTCVPWMAIETKFSKLCIFCSLDEHLYAQLSKWALWLMFVISKIK